MPYKRHALLLLVIMVASLCVPAHGSVTRSTHGDHSIWTASPLPTELWAIVYDYLTTPILCQPATPVAIPVYASVSSSTPMDTVLELVTELGSIPLHRVDEVNALGAITVPSIPTEFSARLVGDGKDLTPATQLAIENGFESISIASSSVQSPLSNNFVRGVGTTDVWGYYLYGAPGEASVVHTREFVERTCRRIAELGATDLYIANTLWFENTWDNEIRDYVPSVQMANRDSGAGEITVEELRSIRDTAARFGLKTHVMHFMGGAAPNLRYLWASDKTDAWLDTLFDEYETLIRQRAAEAQEAGLDGFCVNWQASKLAIRGCIEQVAPRWERILATTRKVFLGNLAFALTTWEYCEAVLNEETFRHALREADSFIFTEWNPGLSTLDDSMEATREGFGEIMHTIGRVKDALQAPLLLSVNLQSADGYLRDGWSDAAIGLVRNPNPDFYEQARAYEGLFDAIAESGAADGLIAFKYDWDDPFGPDLGMGALGRMDLEGDIRNKPAEAVVKRWYEGKAGPASTPILEEPLPRRPWCGQAVFEDGPGCALSLTPLPSELSWSPDVQLVQGPREGGFARVTYTPQTEEWSDLLQLVARAFVPSAIACSVTGARFSVTIDRPEAQLFFSVIDFEGEAFSTELQGLAIDGSPHEVNVVFSDLVFGGFGSPADKNQLLDLDDHYYLQFYLAVPNNGGEPCEFAVGPITLTASTPETDTSVATRLETPAGSPLDTVLEFDSLLDVRLDRDGIVAELSAASCWGLPGCDVESIATGVVDDELLIALELREGDEIGDYTYVLRYVVDEAQDDRLNVYLNPPDGLVYVLARSGGRWGQELVLSDILEIFEDGCQTTIPVSAFAGYFSSADITASCVDLRLIHPSARNEVFVFPGAGCLSSRMAGSNGASDQSLVQWDEVPWRLEFEEGGAGVAGAWKNGQRMDADSLEHWGLAGSEIRGVQVNCVEEGCFVRFSLWEPRIFGEYAYLIHCWQYPQLLYIEIDPHAEKAWMGSRIEDDDVDMHDQIEFVAADAYSATVFVHESSLPTGSATSSALLDFDEMVLIFVYDDGLVHETFEIETQ